MQSRSCVHCNKKFKPKAPHHLFCSFSHRDAFSKGKSWQNYFKSLIKNNSKERKGIDYKYLIYLYRKQKGICALSGVELTKIVGKGVVHTNASIDRIKPKKGYTKRNIRLVCTFINSFRGNVKDEELRWWCKQVIKHGA